MQFVSFTNFWQICIDMTKREILAWYDTIGWISNRMETSVNDGARKSSDWLSDQWQSGKLRTGPAKMV